jgi:pheromone shutdown protein TraB
MPIIQNIDYTPYIVLIGTAHFTIRSIEDVQNYINLYKPNEIALELDPDRFKQLNINSFYKSSQSFYKKDCEFIVASNALGNIDADIWLIDLTQNQIQERINMLIRPLERFNQYYKSNNYLEENPILLWEKGYKQKVIKNTQRLIERDRRYNPSLWRVLIDERNTIMAARTAWILNQKIEKKEKPKLLAFVGAAHTDGIKKLLTDPALIKTNLKEYNLSFTKPSLIRRTYINN